jgi:hypothetical protein
MDISCGIYFLKGRPMAKGGGTFRHPKEGRITIPTLESLREEAGGSEAAQGAHTRFVEGVVKDVVAKAGQFDPDNAKGYGELIRGQVARCSGDVRVMYLADRHKLRGANPVREISAQGAAHVLRGIQNVLTELDTRLTFTQPDLQAIYATAVNQQRNAGSPKTAQAKRSPRHFGPRAEQQQDEDDIGTYRY